MERDRDRQRDAREEASVSDALALLGAGLVLAGLVMIWLPLALIAFGAGLLALAAMRARAGG